YEVSCQENLGRFGVIARHQSLVPPRNHKLIIRDHGVRPAGPDVYWVSPTARPGCFVPLPDPVVPLVVGQQVAGVAAAGRDQQVRGLGRGHSRRAWRARARAVPGRAWRCAGRPRPPTMYHTRSFAKMLTICWTIS